jgi:HD domain/Sugar-specific transcriptional regulator TrmB
MGAPDLVSSPGGPPALPAGDDIDAETGGGSANYRAVMETLSAALNVFDDQTASHARRVTDLALRITRRHDAALAEDPALPYAFLLHDIGKIGIPESILRKAGPLSRREQLIVRRHTLVGERLLALTPSLPPLVHHVVAYHHERWDGTGYPYGLRGVEIPLAARIFAVADAYDALTNDRPYRSAVPVGEAIAELRACSATQFDPDVVETFVGHRAGTAAPLALVAVSESEPRNHLASGFLTNEALVLVCIAENRDARVRTIAARIGITERSTHSILGDLVRRGFVERTRVGRRNRYRLVHSALFGSGFGTTVTVGDLIAALLPEAAG